jgi:hypothetical protein
VPCGFEGPIFSVAAMRLCLTIDVLIYHIIAVTTALKFKQHRFNSMVERDIAFVKNLRVNDNTNITKEDLFRTLNPL